MRSQYLIEHAYDILDQCRADLIQRDLKAIADQLAGTTIQWIEAKSVAGLAYHREKRIELNWNLFADPRNTVFFKQTVIHEIAHIGAPGYGHSRVWKALDLILGGNGRRCHTMDVLKPRTKLEKAVALKKRIYAEIQKCGVDDALKLKANLDQLHDGPSVVDLNPYL